MLLVFGGLPATGKSTVSRGVAQALGAVHVRVDTIEQALREVGFRDVEGEGYELGYKIAADNLSLGNTVVADCVNPIALTRNAWRAVGEQAEAQVIEVEITCSDQLAHRQRVETRAVNIAGLVLPTWQEVQARDYEPWDRPRLVVDTAGETPARSVDRTLALIRSALAQ